MSTDPYVWIDPFEEIEQANRRAAVAREIGRAEATEYFTRGEQDHFRAILDHAYDQCARRLVEEIVFKEARARWSEYQDMDAKGRAVLEILDRISRPIMMAIEGPGQLKADFSLVDYSDEAVPVVQVQVHTIEPINYYIRLDPCGWR